VGRTVALHARGELQQRQLPQDQELSAGHGGHRSGTQRIQGFGVERSPLEAVPPDDSALVPGRLLLLIGVPAGHRGAALLAAGQFRAPGPGLVPIDGHLLGQALAVPIGIVAMPEALVHLVLSLRGRRFVVLALGEFVAIPLRLLAEVQTAAAGVDRRVLPRRRGVLETLRMRVHVLQHLGVVAVGVAKVPVPPVGRLALGVAERTLVLPAAMKESPGAVHLRAGRRRGRTAALRAVRTVAGRVVAERARCIGQRRGW